MILMPQSLKVASKNCGNGRPSATQHCDEVLAQLSILSRGRPMGSTSWSTIKMEVH